MKSKKHKRKVSRVVIFTSDAVDAKIRQIRIRPWICNLILIVLCVMLGTGIGYFVYEGEIWTAAGDLAEEQTQAMNELRSENESLVSEIESLTGKITILSETVNNKVQAAATLEEQLAEQSMPTEFPLTGSASVEEITDGEPICIFQASQGITVISTAKGTVASVEADESYGNKIIVDHGNGYVTIYRNKGEAKVKTGDSVAKGTTLFLIGEENAQLGYQMTKDGVYINPMEMLSISG